MKYIVVAYKPSSTCSHMQCIVAEYSSDFEMIECETEDELINEVAKIKTRNHFLECHEDEYQVIVLKGYIDTEIDNENTSLFKKIDDLIKILVNREIKKIKLENEKRKERIKKEKEEKDRKEYERLKEVFENKK